jgi:hypothetical protein
LKQGPAVKGVDAVRAKLLGAGGCLFTLSVHTVFKPG